MSYVAPGAAFTNSLDTAMLARATAQRQAQKDALEAQHAADQHELELEQLKELKEASANKADDKKQAKVERSIANMVPGDIPDASTVAAARSMNIPLATTTAVPEGQAPAPAPPIRVIQSLGGPTPTPMQTPQPIRFAGNPADRRKVIEDQKQADYIKTLPADSPERKALEYEQMTGKTAPAGMFQKPTTDTEAIFQQNPTNGTVERMVDGKWVPWKGDVPKGAHFMTVPAPKDTSAKDAREDTRRDNNYKSAITELEKAALPIAAQVDTINSLGTMITARTPPADALIAPMVLKATVSGAGSGFRMTQSEINQVIGGRSKWQDLEAKLNKWSTDPSQALSITDEQRTQLRDLAKAIRAKANAKLQKITKARHDLDNADSVDAIHRTMTGLKDDLYIGDDEPQAVLSAAELIKKYGAAGAKK